MSTNLDVLRQAVQKHRPAVIRMRRGGEVELYQVCFLSEARGSTEDGIWVELVEGDPRGIDRLIHTQSMVEVYIESGHTRVFFETPIIRRQRQLLRGDRMLICWPSNLTVQEKRNGRRERVVPGVQIGAKLKVGPVEVTTGVRDVSLTGVGLAWPKGVQLPQPEPGSAVELCLIFGGGEHRLNVELRRVRRMPNGDVRVGVRFADERPEAGRMLERLQPLLDELAHQRVLNSLGKTLGIFAA